MNYSGVYEDAHLPSHLDNWKRKKGIFLNKAQEERLKPRRETEFLKSKIILNL